MTLPLSKLGPDTVEDSITLLGKVQCYEMLLPQSLGLDSSSSALL